MVKIFKNVELGFWGESVVCLMRINISDIKNILERKGKRKFFFDIVNLNLKFIYFL